MCKALDLSHKDQVIAPVVPMAGFAFKTGGAVIQKRHRAEPGLTIQPLELARSACSEAFRKLLLLEPQDMHSEVRARLKHGPAVRALVE